MRIIPALYRLFQRPRLSRMAEAVFEWRAGLRARRNRNQKADTGLKERFCVRPFETFELAENGSVFLCCPSWLRQRAGNLHEQSAEAIWNSEAAQDIRRGILDGSFSHCNHEVCPSIQGGTLPTRAEASGQRRLREIIAGNKTVMEGIPRFINFSHDKSCNLSCPSCRPGRIQFNDGPGYESRKSLHDRLVEAFLTKPTDQPFTLSVTGSGDPFASRVFREFLFSFDGSRFPKMRVNLQTNGVMFTRKTWNRMRGFHGRVNAVLVSFDAATPATYAVTRRGGDWEQLLENMEFLAQLRRQGEIRTLWLCFVVQHANFREMPGMVALGKRFGVDKVTFSKALWWGTWSLSEMRNQRVWNSGHPDHAEFARMIVDPVFDDPIVLLGNIVPERSRILARGPLPASIANPAA